MEHLPGVQQRSTAVPTCQVRQRNLPGGSPPPPARVSWSRSSRNGQSGRSWKNSTHSRPPKAPDLLCWRDTPGGRGSRRCSRRNIRRGSGNSYLSPAPPLTEVCVPKIAARRMTRLEEKERMRFAELPALLAGVESPGRNALLAEFGTLCARSDAYTPLKSGEAPLPSSGRNTPTCDGSEAAELRRSGELLQLFSQLKVSISVIHGDADPHRPKEFGNRSNRWCYPSPFHLLPRCGHTPREEKFAREPFLRLLARELFAEMTNRIRSRRPRFSGQTRTPFQGTSWNDGAGRESQRSRPCRSKRR